MSRPAWVTDVLDYWFETLGPPGWFSKNDKTDAAIRDRFGTLHRNLTSAPPDAILEDSASALAAIIVFDQFSRNMFRGTPQAFASDERALDLARRAIDLGHDTEIPADRRIFFYLPFEHSENIAHQHRSIDLISALQDPEWTRYAEAHKAVIERFGRFPHRNAVLGRSSTEAELAFLDQPGSAF